MVGGHHPHLFGLLHQLFRDGPGLVVRQVSAVCGGKGGGKPDSAMGGGTDAGKLDEALASVFALVKSKLG